MVVSNRASMKRARVDGAATTISGKKFGEGSMEVVGNKGGDNVLFAIGDDKEVMGTNCIEVILPSGARMDARLGTIGTRSALFEISIHDLGF